MTLFIYCIVKLKRSEIILIFEFVEEAFLAVGLLDVLYQNSTSNEGREATWCMVIGIDDLA